MPPSAGESAGVAQPLDSPPFGHHGGIARRHGVWISRGGLHERDSGRAYDTHAFVDGVGLLAAAYRKPYGKSLTPPVAAGGSPVGSGATTE